MQSSGMTAGITAGILLLLIVSPATAAAFRTDSGTGCAPLTPDLQVRVSLTGIPTGLSGLNVSFAVSDPETAQITGVTVPAWAQMYDVSAVPAQQVRVRMVDLQRKVSPNDPEAPIATVSIHALKNGNAFLTITPDTVEDDAGNLYTVASASQPLCFSDTPGSTRPAAPALPDKATESSQSPEVVTPKITYSPLPGILPVLSIVLAAIAVCRFRRSKEE